MAILNFILNSPEVRGWHSGGAPLTVIINLLTCFQASTLIVQTRKVFVERSALGLSVLTMTFYAFYFAAFLIYGVAKGSLTMVASGAQFVLYIPLIIGLWKYGGDQAKKQLRFSVPVFALIPPAMFLTSEKEIFLLILFAGILVSVWLMYRELKRVAGVGSVAIKFQYAFLVNSVFWFIYGVAITDWPLIIFNPLSAVLLTMTILLYTKKKRALRT